MTQELPDLIAQRTALLDAWVAKQRQIAILQAESMALLTQRTLLWDEEVAMAPMHRDSIERSMVCEYAAAGHVSKGSMEYAFSDARLVADFPMLWASFSAGKITPMHVREVIRESSPVRKAIDDGTVDPDTLALYEAAVIEVAESDTSMRTRVHARQVAAALAGSTVTEQHERARKERKITVRSVGDGLALLQAVLPEHLALAIQDRLTKMAQHMRQHPEDRDVELPFDVPDEVVEDLSRDVPDVTTPDPGPFSTSTAEAPAQRADSGAIFGDETFSTDPFDMDSPFCEAPEVPLPPDPMFHSDSPCIIRIPADARSIDQRRADLLADLLLTGGPSDAHGDGLDRIRATIQVTVAATTLAGSDDRPAELDGHGPLHPDTARKLAGNHTGWTRLFTDPTGMIVESDTYTPPESMRRYLRARDQRCQFPGCQQPVSRSQIDHNFDYAKGGPTRLDNLSHFCASHHPLKHPDIAEEHRWTARQLPDRSVVWTSPNGRSYPDPAPRRVMFVPSDETDLWSAARASATQSAQPAAQPAAQSAAQSAAQAAAPF